ncbi:hypothetical protein GGX14DRAFT_699718 [Mycena pura]|uniref:Thioesterase n=1 Tax=Mycena pura TaxID=153505 RepID=A0AAD6V3T0_9AGAR|nr:hypothetical protein GGX14DRAFT_699718 [Mycena pura]
MAMLGTASFQALLISTRSPESTPRLRMLAASLQNARRLAPAAAKYIALALLLLNVGSWPLVWHFRVFASVVKARLALRWHRITHVFSSREEKQRALQAFYEAHQPIGLHPFRHVWSFTKFVGIDDGDFNLHMSNSSYAQALDSVRLRLALATFPNLFRCGGWSPLAATHFHFIREIPMLTYYEIRASIGAWDDKWFYVVFRFVKPPSKSKSGARITGRQSETNGAGEAPRADSERLLPVLTTPATPLTNGGSTPAVLVWDAPDQGAQSEAVSRALLARAAQQTTEPDGALLYTVSVSQLCFKQGRITVPPAVVLAANGFYAAPAAATPPPLPPSQSPTTKPAAPPHWPAVRALAAPSISSLRLPVLAAFYAGGWRAVPPGARWWEDAFAACEDERRARLASLGEGGLRGGMDGARGLV